MALYRKYRPRNFASVVGQNHITTTLLNELRANKTFHAYLFTGTRGTGKTTSARILAKALNCHNQRDGEPCLECDNCKGIENESLMDVIEIDAASTSGVDNIRSLKEEAYFSPSVCRYRIYIIDEVHMLTNQAFNALLKIIEEPPAHVVFILATTEVNKIPATILSRCQRFDFYRINTETIKEHLLNISKNEGIELTEKGAITIANISDGGMRDALSILDKCANTVEFIDESAVEEIAGISNGEYLISIVEAITKKESQKLIEILAQLYYKSKDLTRLIFELSSLVRDILVVKSKGTVELLNPLADRDRLQSIADNQSESYLLNLADKLFSIYKSQNLAKNVYIETELSLLSLCSEEVETTVAVAGPREVQSKQNTAKISTTKQNPIAKIEKPPVDETNISSGSQSGQDTIKNTSTEPKAVLAEGVVQGWDKIVEEIFKVNKLLGASLLNSSAYFVGNRILIDAQNPNFLNLVRENEKSKKDIKETIERILGKPYPIGPYNGEAKVEVEENPLDSLLSEAENLGVDIKIKEN